jgi:hypothetical protein
MGLMHKKSIAKNHLSEVANEGRYGDNILVHMNKDEAAVLAKSAGLNSLPINPKTGLQEAWVMAAAGLALGAYAAWKGGKMAAGQAGSQAGLTKLQLDEINKAETNLLPTKEANTEVAIASYHNEGNKLGLTKQETSEDLNKVINKSGLVSSAGATEKKSNLWKKFAQEETGLHDKLGQTMASIEEEYESEKARLSSEKNRLELQERQFSKQADSWYLGKNLFG